MNFECHITVSTEHAEKATFFALNAPFLHDAPQGGKWKTSEIARDPVLGADTYFYLTAHDTAYEKMHVRMKYAAAWLEANGVPVLREKIELIMYDTKQKSAQPIPDADLQAMWNVEQSHARLYKAGEEPLRVVVREFGRAVERRHNIVEKS